MTNSAQGQVVHINPGTLSKHPAFTPVIVAFNYFKSHGPAQLKDFSWRSGLSVADAKEALGLINSELERAILDDKTYWFPASTNPTSTNVTALKPLSFLQSIYDEYTIAYKDRSAISEARDIERMISMGNALTAVLIK